MTLSYINKFKIHPNLSTNGYQNPSYSHNVLFVDENYNHNELHKTQFC